MALSFSTVRAESRACVSRFSSSAPTVDSNPAFTTPATRLPRGRRSARRENARIWS